MNNIYVEKFIIQNPAAVLQPYEQIEVRYLVTVQDIYNRSAKEL